MLFLQDAGRTKLAQTIAALPIYLAIGRGLPAWDSAPEPPPATATQLVDEIGRLRVIDITYVVPHEAGSITMPAGARYNPSAKPTRWLLLRANLEFGHAQGEQVREFGVFIGGATDPALPPGQLYFSRAQVTDIGTPYAIERHPVETRSGEKSTLEMVVLPF